MRKVLKAAIVLMCALVIFIPTYAFATDSGGESIMGMDSPGMDDDTARSYDYIEFGSYPQTEIVSQAKDSGVYEKEWATDSDYIIDPELYNTLAGLSDDKWDANGDTTLDGNKYRRIKKSDATGTKSEDTSTTTTDIESTKDAPASENDSVTMYYNWSSDSTYHYFKYEPIKWRILQQDGNDIFLLAEKALDCQMYSKGIESTLTWETSRVRSWLNGYDGSTNLDKEDYSNKNFINTAFTSEEQKSIKTTSVENKDSTSGVSGGSNTNDKIYLLSTDEVYGDTATGYGFYSSAGKSITRRTTSSTYAKAMGVKSNDASTNNGKYTGNCFWWLRSPGSYTGIYTAVEDTGRVSVGGYHAMGKCRGVRPAMHIDTSLTDVSLNKTSLSLKPGDSETLTATITPSYATNNITWSSSDTNVATVTDGVVAAVNYGTATITATSAYDNTKIATCTVNVVPEAVVDAGYTASLTLNDNIDINFRMTGLGSNFVKSNLVITVDDVALDADKITYDDNNKEVTCVLKAVIPKNMDESVSTVITYNGVTIKSFNYSIRSYCEYVFNHHEWAGYSVALDNLCKAVLNYGAWADNFFNGKTNSTVNEGYVIDFSSASVPTPGYSSSLGKTITKASADLTLESEMTLSFNINYTGNTELTNSNVNILAYDTVVDSNDNLKINGDGVTVSSDKIKVNKLTGTYNYRISVTNIGASQLGKAYKLVLGDDYIYYGVYNYCDYVVNKSTDTTVYTDTLKTLCKSIHNYGEMAKAYK